MAKVSATSEDVFLNVSRRHQCRTGCNVPDALATNQFRWHHELLRRQVWLLNAPQRKFREMSAKLFGKLTHGCKSGMEHFADRVIVPRNADVVGNPNA